jgi:ABC-type transporter Mla subunit MlaD
MACRIQIRQAIRAMPELRKILEETRPALEAGLAGAERELAELDNRRRELEALIARARAALGEAAPRAPTATRERLTLHQALELVLRENDNRWMTVRELADEINARELYEKRDRTPIDPSQIHARANKYASMFEKDGANVRLAYD